MEAAGLGGVRAARGLDMRWVFYWICTHDSLHQVRCDWITEVKIWDRFLEKFYIRAITEHTPHESPKLCSATSRLIIVPSEPWQQYF